MGDRYSPGGRLYRADRSGHRRRHTGRCRWQDFRTFLHDERAGEGDRAWPVHRLRHREAVRRFHFCRQYGRRAWRQGGCALHDLPAGPSRPRGTRCEAGRADPRRAGRRAAGFCWSRTRTWFVPLPNALLRGPASKSPPCADGEEGLAAFANEEPFDLVISDVVMPGMDGPTMAKGIRRVSPDLPILFMSGYAEEQLRKDIDVPDMHFISKPFSVQQISQKAGEVIGTDAYGESAFRGINFCSTLVLLEQRGYILIHRRSERARR